MGGPCYFPAIALTVAVASWAGDARADDRAIDAEERTLQAWTARMESAIWLALQQANRQFTGIDHVSCAYPVCEVQFTAADAQGQTFDASWNTFLSDLQLEIGTDEGGTPIFKQSSMGTRETSPGNFVVVVSMTTERNRIGDVDYGPPGGVATP